MLVTILDGYTDEPSRLGVPPFISPQPRYIAGAVTDAGHDFEYMTVDHWRQERRPRGEITVVLHGARVPGKYLRTMPVSSRELTVIRASLEGEAIIWSPERKGDADAFLYDLLTTGKGRERRREQDEWSRWAVAGSAAVTQHQDHPQPLIAELDMSYGCPHYITGGCSFCTEPQYGEPVHREVDAVLDEVKALLKAGVTNFRLGGQSCIFSYKSEEIGEKPVPEPNVREIGRLLKGLAKLDGIRVLHTDNADPSVLATHPEESAEILDMLVKTCTSGNSLSLGMESADPRVIEANNLNATPEQVLKAVKLINKVGASRGPTGLPQLLPGLNFIGGLDGETRETYELNIAFLEEIVKSGMALRRINIRQVAPVRRSFGKTRHQKDFHRFKKHVRDNIDTVMLERVAPLGTVMKGVYAELKMGKLVFGRQIGTYPLLVGIPQDLELDRFYDVRVTGHGSRSLTAVEYPLRVNDCQMSALEALPGIGRKRAARIVKARPIRTLKDLEIALEEPALADQIRPYLEFSNP